MPEGKGNGSSALETLKRFYDAESAYMASGGGSGFSAIADTLHSDCVIYQPASLPYGGEWRGYDGFEAWMKAFAQQWSSLNVKDSQFFPSDDIIFSKSHVLRQSARNRSSD